MKQGMIAVVFLFLLTIGVVAGFIGRNMAVAKNLDTSLEATVVFSGTTVPQANALGSGGGSCSN
ncbi:hypothetical protein K9L63_03410 [Candidatus Gracilibacteria bacterium]|nr:hypothetical protein [Candidatus Gracilibacteria bacterium]